tara:strand:- start:408 stop:701 length:294 start_codon:yes stop_codon:yes gene_type:complete
MSADIIDMNKKTIKRGKKKLSTEEQCELLYDRLLNLSEELQDTVTIPNMVIGLQQFVCQLAYDTAPSNATASHMLLGIIAHRLEHEVELEQLDNEEE